MKEEYTAKEILLGLRDEYLKVQAKLKEIDNFLDYDRDKYKTYFYLTHRSSKIDNYLLTFYTTSNCSIEGVRNLFNKLSRIYKQEHDYSLTDYPPIATIDSSKQNEFRQYVKELTTYNYLRVLKNKRITNLFFSPTLMKMKITRDFTLTYSPINDSINFVDKNERLTDKKIFEMLDYKYDSDILTMEARKIIDNNPNTPKNFVLKPGKFKHDESFYLIDRPKTFVLRRERKTIF